ncbi:hypothetical protein K1719_033205 [Acacia pycnantha]|nr:hypothetical protein K1719_033205 [Acacia pycnantha]
MELPSNMLPEEASSEWMNKGDNSCSHSGGPPEYTGAGRSSSTEASSRRLGPLAPLSPPFFSAWLLGVSECPLATKCFPSSENQASPIGIRIGAIVFVVCLNAVVINHHLLDLLAREALVALRVEIQDLVVGDKAVHGQDAFALWNAEGGRI